MIDPFSSDEFGEAAFHAVRLLIHRLQDTGALSPGEFSALLRAAEEKMPPGKVRIRMLIDWLAHDLEEGRRPPQTKTHPDWLRGVVDNAHPDPGRDPECP